MTPEAQEAASKRPRWGQEPPPNSYADLSSIDRCMGSTGLPIIPAPYNNNVQIFQTPDHVAILIESMHLSRIVSLDGRPDSGSTSDTRTTGARAAITMAQPQPARLFRSHHGLRRVRVLSADKAPCS